MSVMNYIANILTASRFLLAVGMVLAAPFSPVFWVCYLGGGAFLLRGGVCDYRQLTHVESELKRARSKGRLFGNTKGAMNNGM